MSITHEGPQFTGEKSLAMWAVEDRLPWLIGRLGLTAGAICGSVPESVRREVIGLTADAPLPTPLDWSHNGIVISPPGTGKGMAIFIEALAHYERVFVLVPSVIQAHKLEESIDTLYHRDVGGCRTSQRKAPGLISVITTGIFHQMVKDRKSALWADGTVLIVDEAQRILEQDPLTEFMVGYAAHCGVRTMIVSATVAPGTLPQVYGGPGKPAKVYDLEATMNPVELRSVPAQQGQEMRVLAESGALEEAGKTTLVFAPGRRQIAGIVRQLREVSANPEIDVDVVPVAVTGAHIVEEQLEQIRRGQATGKPVVVVATPGTMDSSVTIPGLSLVVILDRRTRVDWNQFEVRERWSEGLPINHIWQMIRRVGRQKRSDGKLDQVVVLSPTKRTDIEAKRPQFEPIEGCSPHTPLEDLLLAAVYLDVPFGDVHDYMVSTFPDYVVDATTHRLREAGMIEDVADLDDPDGFQLTDLGRQAIALPYEYRWNRLVLMAEDEERWRQLMLLASFGRLDDLEMYEAGLKRPSVKARSELLLKLDLGVTYVDLGHDDEQRQLAREGDLSFRRLEQVETLYALGCSALGLDFRAPLEPAGREEDELLDFLVLRGLEVGLFDLFFPGLTEKGWSDPRPTADGQLRRFFFPEKRLDFDRYQAGNTAAVVGVPTWFTGRNGQPMGSVDDVSFVPVELVADLVRERAEAEGWLELTFSADVRELSAEKDGYRYVVSRMDAQPVAGRPYWCSIDRHLTPYVRSVIVHYPVLDHD